jgi:superfamily II DNA or RNA helicase
MKYISDAVGEEYKQWKPGDIVFLSSPTGSGKTTFVLKVLLPALASVNGKMLYLVNRSILKRQMEEELRDFPLEQQRCIKIELYQTIEKRILTLSEYVPNRIYQALSDSQQQVCLELNIRLHREIVL